MNTTKWIFYLGACALGLQLHAAPMGSAFTYQGRLHTGGAQALDGLYDFRFTLYDAETDGSAVGVADDISAVPVTNGLFTVQIDFLLSPFTTGEARWLQLQVNTNAVLPLITLQPRQRLTPTPQAIYAGMAASATTASGVAPNAVGPAGLTNGAVTSAKIADGTIVAGDLSPDLMNARFWRLTGNSGPAIGFLGTTDNRPLEFKVNGRRALRLEPVGSSDWVNVIGGSERNSTALGVVSATISGGDNNSIQDYAYFGSIGGGEDNRIQTNTSYATIGGGWQNTIQDYTSFATIGGGGQNTIQPSADYTTIGGGGQNMIQSSADYSTIGGGYTNRVQAGAIYASIGGGYQNTIQTNAHGATIGGGYDNVVQADAVFASIGGGSENTIQLQAEHAGIGGGSENTIQSNAWHARIGGGQHNTIQTGAGASFIGGGAGNTIQTNAHSATVGGGALNTIQKDAHNATIGGGFANLIQTHATFASIGGGYENTIQTNARYSTLGGGYQNTIQTNASFASIGGGYQNIIQSNAAYAIIGGGQANRARGHNTTIGGGFGNDNSGGDASIGGGSFNTILASAAFATIPGGRLNVAGDAYTFAAGRRAKANHFGAFVWADSTDADFASTAVNQFRVRATGGMEVVGGSGSPAFRFRGSRNGGLFTPVGLAENNNTIGQSAPALRVSNQGGDSIDGALSVSANGTGSIATFGNAVTIVSRLTTDGTWTALAFNATSDRNAKENFQPVNPRAVLDRVVNMPMTRWNYKAAAGVPHIGPMAQDFHAAFGVGTDDKHIATVDADGVALAAIQGLNQKVEEQRWQMAAKDDRVAALETTVKQLQAAVAQLTREEKGSRP